MSVAELFGNDAAAWHRLHPLSPVVRAGRSLIPIVIVLAPALVLRGQTDLGRSYGELGVAAVLVTLGVVSWLVTRWRIEGGDLRIETGLIRRSSLRFPLSQIQAIDTVRPGLARVLGLAELRLRMGGSTGASGRLAYLTAHEAEIVRGQLLALARGDTEGVTPPAETVLVTIPTPRLVVSILLSRSGIVAELVLLALLLSYLIAPAAATAVIGAGAFAILGLASAIWRRFNSGYQLTVADAPDGLRLRSGLLETTAETIRPGRVQALRMVEPLLWRPFGWCRFEVDVAGSQKKKGENRSRSRQLRSLLPVGQYSEAQALLARLLPDAPPDRLPPPPRARRKSPLRYRYLAWGLTDGSVVTTTGRVTRTTEWIPLAKVQSLRWAQGPVQRRFALATIHLDTAGRNLRGAIRDRDQAEADSALSQLVRLCRQARQSDAGTARAEA